MDNALVYFALWFYYKTIECSADLEVLEAMGWDKEQEGKRWMIQVYRNA